MPTQGCVSRQNGYKPAGQCSAAPRPTQGSPSRTQWTKWQIQSVGEHKPRGVRSALSSVCTAVHSNNTTETERWNLFHGLFYIKCIAFFLNFFVVLTKTLMTNPTFITSSTCGQKLQMSWIVFVLFSCIFRFLVFIFILVKLLAIFVTCFCHFIIYLLISCAAL